MVNDTTAAAVSSMTGYAARDGQADGVSWTWELRSVNARGLDLRLRLPDGLGALEAPLRKLLAERLTRGAVNLSLRLVREAGGSAARVNDAALSAVLDGFAQIARAGAERGLEFAAPSLADVHGMKGVADGADTVALPEAETLLRDVSPALAAFVEMRQSEGAALRDVLLGQVERVETLVAEAEIAARQRGETQAARFAANLANLLEGPDMPDPDRLAQEVAILAVKADVMEEIDRLRAHVGAARALLSGGGPVGRKLDFLMQEFNREANTLCSKSGDAALTAVGLDLKLTIDQMREQVQNLE